MFILYAVAAGLAAGFALRGSLDRLGRLPLRWGAVAVAGLAVQVALFAEPAASLVGDLGAPLYVASTVAVLAMVVRNARLAGFPIIAAGAAGNLAAILANGGCMPADAAALASLGRVAAEGFSNSCTTVNASLAPLTDVIALPAWLPFTNVISIGDVLIGAGIVIAIVAGMRGPGGRSGASTH